MEQPRPRILRMLEGGGRVAWQVVGIAAVLWVLGNAFAAVREVLLAVFVALVVGAIAEPVSSRLERLGLRRAWSSTIALVVVIGSLGASLVFVGYGLVAELPDVVEDLAGQREEVLSLLSRPPLSLSEEEVGMLLDRGIDEATRAAVPEGSDGPVADTEEAEAEGDGEGPTPGATIAVIRALVRAARIVGAMLVGLVLAFFLVRDRDVLINSSVGFLAGGEHDTAAYAAMRSGWRAMIGYVRGSVLVGSIDAVLIGAALFLLGVPLAGVLTVLTFLSGFVPVVGATAAGLAAVGVTFVSVGTGQALGLLVWIIAVQQLDGNVLQPLVMQEQTNLHPVVTILALTTGGLVGGVLGALMAVPLAAVVSGVVGELLRSAEPSPA